MTTHIEDGPDDRPEAVRAEGAGARAWRSVVPAQRSATPDHADFSALAAELVDMLGSVAALARVLVGQVRGYPHGLPAGHELYDDSRHDPTVAVPGVDPRARLWEAQDRLGLLRRAVDGAGAHAHAFGSAIGHVGVEPVDDADGSAGPGVSR